MAAKPPNPLSKFIPYALLLIGLTILSFVSHLTMPEVGRLMLVLVGSLLISSIVFYYLDVGYFRSYRESINLQLSQLSKIVTAFTGDSKAIVPTLSDNIVPAFNSSSAAIDRASDKLSHLIHAKELIDRFVLFQGTEVYREALKRSLDQTPVHDVRFMGTLIGARDLLFDPLLNHILDNPGLRRIRLIASRELAGGNDLRLYAINFCAMLVHQLLTLDSHKAFRERLNTVSGLSIEVKYLPTDIYASVFIIGDRLFILAPTHGLDDYEQVPNFNIGLIIPREAMAAGQKIWGNDIITRQSRLFDSLAGPQPDDMWTVESTVARMESNMWSFTSGKLQMGQAQTGRTLTPEECKGIAEAAKTQGRLVGAYDVA